MIILVGIVEPLSEVCDCDDHQDSEKRCRPRLEVRSTKPPEGDAVDQLYYVDSVVTHLSAAIMR